MKEEDESGSVPSKRVAQSLNGSDVDVMLVGAMWGMGTKGSIIFPLEVTCERYYPYTKSNLYFLY